MIHPSEEELVDGYYSGMPAELKLHLANCTECLDLYRRISEALDLVSEARDVPARSESYGAEVWANVAPRLPQKHSAKVWLWAPAIAAMLALAFFAGIWVQQGQTKPPDVRFVMVKAPVPPDPVVPEPVLKLDVSKVPVKHSDREQDQKLVVLNTQLQLDEKAALPQLVEIVKGPNSDRTKAHALFVMAQSDSAEAHQALLTIAAQDQNPQLRTTASQMVFQARPLMVNAGQRVRLTSEFLSGDRQAVLGILERQTNPADRVATVQSLGVLGESGEVLAAVYRTDQNDKVRQAVLDALVSQHNRQALENLANREANLLRRAEINRRLQSVR